MSEMISAIFAIDAFAFAFFRSFIASHISMAFTPPLSFLSAAIAIFEIFLSPRRRDYFQPPPFSPIRRFRHFSSIATLRFS
jgi:hypothetical protein